ncbi:MAG: hypothetical protein ABMA15_00460 [Vicinamibacterales bacterium]
MFLMRNQLFAQSILEYVGLGSWSEVNDSARIFISNLWQGLLGIEQRTWMIIGGVLIVLWFLTRRSRMR